LPPNDPENRAHARDTRHGVRCEISASNVRSLTTDEGARQQNVQHVDLSSRGFHARETRVPSEADEGPRARPAARTRPNNALARSLVCPRVRTPHEIIVVARI